MKLRKLDKKGVTLQEAPYAVLVIGFVFLLMATIAYVGEEYQDSLTENSSAWNVSQDLQDELGDNTSLAGLVLTIVLVGIVLGVLIGVFAFRGRRI
jgi:uncharacterized membrane protein